jgi:hypothetical protein
MTVSDVLGVAEKEVRADQRAIPLWYSALPVDVECVITGMRELRIALDGQPKGEMQEGDAELSDTPF